jgi:putative endonuclease
MRTNSRKKPRHQRGVCEKKFRRTGSFYVYIVECADGTYYTGYTPDIERRIKLHNAGRGAKYTADRRPVRLVWCKEYRHFKRAFKKEIALKRLTRGQKEKLIAVSQTD